MVTDDGYYWACSIRFGGFPMWWLRELFPAAIAAVLTVLSVPSGKRRSIIAFMVGLAVWVSALVYKQITGEGWDDVARHYVVCSALGICNEVELAQLYRRAADQGDASAQANLGVFYATGGGGLPKDDWKAATLYKSAADQGFAGGQFDLGAFYEEGRGGLPKSDQEAARLYKLAAAQGLRFRRAIFFRSA